MTKEEVLSKHPKMSRGRKVTLVLPLLLSVSWIIYLQVGGAATGTELLAPVNTAPLMIALIIFTAGYVIFLLMMFSENIKEFFAEKIKH